jgi:hypothetical protein
MEETEGVMQMGWEWNIGPILATAEEGMKQFMAIACVCTTIGFHTASFYSQ